MEQKKTGYLCIISVGYYSDRYYKYQDHKITRQQLIQVHSIELSYENIPFRNMSTYASIC